MNSDGSDNQQQLQPHQSSENQKSSQAVPSFLRVGQAEESKRQHKVREADQRPQEPHNLQQQDQVFAEFQQELKSLEALKQRPENSVKLIFEKLESLTQETKFQLLPQIQNDAHYIKLWIEYASTVKDSNTVYEYAIEHQIGQHDPQIYVSLALFYEKYHRNFDLADQAYKKAIASLTQERQLEITLQKYKEFSERMKKRIERDVVGALGVQEYEKINNKKRKFEDAFPEQNSSNSSSQSTRRRRIQEEVKQFSESLKDYKEGIEYLKKNNDRFEEIKIDQNILNELAEKPFSWMFRAQQDLKERKSQTRQQCLLVQNQSRLEPIGELSMEMGSSFAQSRLLGQQDSSNTKHFIHKQSLDSQAFHTANNSANQTALQIINEHPSQPRNIQQQRAQNQGQEQANFSSHNDVKLEELRMHHESIFNRYNIKQEDKQAVQGILEEMIKMMSKKGSEKEVTSKDSQVRNDHQKIKMPFESSQIQSTNQQTQQVFPNLPIQTQPIFSSRFHHEVNRPLNQQQLFPQPSQQIQQQKKENESKQAKRFSGILMNLIENNTQNQQTNQQKSPFKPEQAFEPRKDYFNTQFFPTNGHYANRFSGIQGNNIMSMNNSFLDGTPQDQNFGRQINPNYSRDFFQKKKTLSKAKIENGGGEDEDCQGISNQYVLQSLFGPVSPMANHEYSARKSNPLRDCGGGIFMSFGNEIGPRCEKSNNGILQNLYSQRQSQVSNHYQPQRDNSRGRPSQNFFQCLASNQANTYPAVNRDSVDSLGQAFKDCNDSFNNANNQQHSHQSKDHSKLPSALKSAQAVNDENFNSRNNSKSVRFLNY